jgi:hypothetical protein
VPARIADLETACKVRPGVSNNIQPFDAQHGVNSSSQHPYNYAVQRAISQSEAQSTASFGMPIIGAGALGPVEGYSTLMWNTSRPKFPSQMLMQQPTMRNFGLYGQWNPVSQGVESMSQTTDLDLIYHRTLIRSIMKDQVMLERNILSQSMNSDFLLSRMLSFFLQL